MDGMYGWTFIEVLAESLKSDDVLNKKYQKLKGNLANV